MNFWWSCKSCGWESYDSPNAYRHTSETGHEGHALVSNHIGSGPGSTPAAREAARAATVAAVTAAKERRKCRSEQIAEEAS